MLKTFALRQREIPLTVYGPPGLRDLFGSLRRVFGKLTYPLEPVEVRPGGGARARRLPDPGVPGAPRGVCCRLRARRGRAARAVRRRGRRRARRARTGRSEARSSAASRSRSRRPRAHARTRCSGDARAGRRVVLPGDSAPTETVRVLAEDADLLVHEATFGEDERERAAETLHSTAVQAAELARDAGVRLLALTHLSTALLRARARARGAGGVREHGRAARLRRDRGAVPRAWAAEARPARRAGPPREAPVASTEPYRRARAR